VSWLEKTKETVASEAVKHVKDGFIVGLGSGSTAAYAIKELGRLICQDKIQVKGIPSSSQAKKLAVNAGIPLTTLDEHPLIDLVIDGADEVDKELNMIKGGGGALTREKIIASASKQVVIIADEKKFVEKLGSTFKVPIEVLDFAFVTVFKEIEDLGGLPVLREGNGKVGPVVTDNGNYIIDVDFGPINKIKDLNQELKLLPGVIETGLFIDLADIVYLGKRDQITKLEK
jgi:ribose 5-phosphate isomerase A